MSDNPFEPPETSQPDEGRGLGILGIEKDFLVVTSCTTLPNRCVLTNSTEHGLRFRQRKLTFSSKAAALNIFAPTCIITFALSSEIARTFARRRVVVRSTQYAILISVLLVLRFLPPQFNSLAVPIMALATIALSLVPLEPIWIERYENGAFWIRGCDHDFLDFAQEFAIQLDEPEGEAPATSS